MNKWRVYNRHPDGLTHKEKFRGDDFVIKAGEYILMDYEDAIMFKGQYFPMMERGDGTQDPKTYKCIEIKPDGDTVIVEPTFSYISPVDGKKFNSQAELDAYIKSNFSHLETVKDSSLDLEISKKGKR